GERAGGEDGEHRAVVRTVVRQGAVAWVLVGGEKAPAPIDGGGPRFGDRNTGSLQRGDREDVGVGRRALVVVRGLQVVAVGVELSVGLGRKGADRSLAPARGERVRGQEEGGNEQTHRFRDQVVVGDDALG